jgi:hypothetical protein
MFKARFLGFALAFVGGFSLLASHSPAQVSQGGNHPNYPGGIERRVPNPGPIGGKIDIGGKIQPKVPDPRPGGGAADGGGKIQPKEGQAGFAICFGDGTDGKCPNGHVGLKGHGCDNSVLTGGALLEATGAAKVSKDTMHFQVTGMVPETTAIFFQGPVLSKVGTPFGDGLLCLYGPVTKIATKSTIYGAVEYPQYGDEPICDKGQIPPFGATRYYQVMYRDEGSAHGEKNHFNLSNAWMTVWVP